MTRIPGRRHLQAAARPNAPSYRWRMATKAGATGTAVIGGSLLAGDMNIGMSATLGAFTVLYGGTAPALYRLKLLASVAAGLVLSVTVGSLTAFSPWIDVAALTGTAAVATFLCVVFRVGPPGAMFFVLVHGVASMAVLHGTDPARVVLSTAVGAAAAVVIGMSDLLLDPRKPERQAVEAAEAAMSAYEGETDPAALVSVRHATSMALARAWGAVTDAGSPAGLSARLWEVQARYAASGARTVEAELGLAASPWGRLTEETDRALPMDMYRDVDVDVARDPTPTEHGEDSPGSAAAQVRDTSLGRPSAGPTLRAALTWPSEPLLVVLRVTVATVVASGIARLVGVDHAYWTAAFAMLVLHQGGTRDAQIVRGIQRGGGTVLGVVVFLLIVWLDPHGWALVLLIAALQFFIELVVAVNYGLAVVAITPLALIIGTHANAASSPMALLGERTLDTIIAIVIAFAVLFSVGRGSDVPILRSYARRVVHGIDAVLVDIAAGRVETGTARENRRRLYHSLLESAETARRVHADGGAGVEPYRDMEATLSQLGYLVLGLAWHPDTRRAHDLARRSRGPLDRILAHPVRGERPAEEIHDDVLELRRIVTGWRPPLGRG